MLQPSPQAKQSSPRGQMNGDRALPRLSMQLSPKPSSYPTGLGRPQSMSPISPNVNRDHAAAAAAAAAAEFYLKDYLSSPTQASDDAIKKTLDDIKKSKNAAENDLKSAVSKFHSQIISSSKDISKMESDMLDLRNYLSESLNVIQSLQKINVEITLSSCTKTNSKQSQAKPSDDAAVMKAISNIANELEELMEEHKFEEAVELLEKKKTEMESTLKTKETIAFFTTKYEENCKKLGDRLIIGLSNPNMKKRDTKRLIGHLLKLNMGEEARELFLATKSKYIKKQIRKLRFGGDITSYIGELSRLVFSAIKQTGEDYLSSFVENANTCSSSSMSEFIVWATQELEKFGKTFRRQVFYCNDFRIISECLEIARLHCNVLEEKGLSLSFFLWQMFRPTVIQLISNYTNKIESSLSRQLVDDPWMSHYHYISQPENSSKPLPTIQLTDSAKALYSSVEKFISDILNIATVDILPEILESLGGLIENYLFRLSHQLTNEQLNKSQLLAILTNSSYITEDLFPRMIEQLEAKLNISTKDPNASTAQVQKRLSLTHSSMLSSLMFHVYIFMIQGSFCSSEASKLISHINPAIQGGSVYSAKRTSKTENSENISLPSAEFRSLVNAVVELKNMLEKQFPDSLVCSSMRQILDEIIIAIARSPILKEEFTGFGAGGLQLFVLDIQFIQTMFAKYASPVFSEISKDTIAKAIANFAKQNKKDPATLLKKDTWFQKRIKKAASSISM